MTPARPATVIRGTATLDNTAHAAFITFGSVLILGYGTPIAGWFLVGRCEVVQSLLSPIQLSLPPVEAFGDRGEFGAEIRA